MPPSSALTDRQVEGLATAEPHCLTSPSYPLPPTPSPRNSPRYCSREREPQISDLGHYCTAPSHPQHPHTPNCSPGACQNTQARRHTHTRHSLSTHPALASPIRGFRNAHKSSNTPRKPPPKRIDAHPPPPPSHFDAGTNNDRHDMYVGKERKIWGLYVQDKENWVCKQTKRRLG